jgi:ABC-type Zn uptake system ZnuABC Zn-binding protein ZnuA
MKNRSYRWFWGIVPLLFVCGCGQKEDSPRPPEISVTNTYLQSAVLDLTGGEIEVFCLAPPGMCPGHFDMSPEQICRLLNSRILFRFDFQAGLDDKLRRMDAEIIPIQGRPGLCIPQTYLDTCRDMLSYLAAEFPESEAVFAEYLKTLEALLSEIAADIHTQIEEADLKGQAVLVSKHQSEFARWLGLEVTAVFEGTDSMTPSQIAQCLEAGRRHKAGIVIANLQEGTELPRRLAEQLNARLVVFSNFPDPQTEQESPFVQMLRANVENLIP